MCSAASSAVAKGLSHVGQSIRASLRASAPAPALPAVPLPAVPLPAVPLPVGPLPAVAFPAVPLPAASTRCLAAVCAWSPLSDANAFLQWWHTTDFAPFLILPGRVSAGLVAPIAAAPWGDADAPTQLALPVPSDAPMPAWVARSPALPATSLMTRPGIASA
eukprot:scaffold2519_cov108-Isochrysis_galbana.AAC.3